MTALEWKAKFDARNAHWHLIAGDDDLGFSWSPCDTCGSTLGGDRYLVHVVDDGEWDTMESCVDCLMYIANAELPVHLDD